MCCARVRSPDCPKRVAVLGCSTGYGLASRIVATFAGGADTIGVSLEREPTADQDRAAPAGTTTAPSRSKPRKIGRSAAHPRRRRLLRRDEEDFIERVREKFGQLDLLVYSMAAPVRTDPDTGKTYRSAIKPLGEPVEVKTLNTETGEVFETTIAPASEDEAAATVAVMGGDDWKRWIDQLADAGVLAPGFRTLNYTYIGSELTWPIYWNGTLGRAKADLDRKAEAIRAELGAGRGPHRGAEGCRHPGQLGHSGGAALWHGAVQGDEGDGPARRLHRADRPPVPDPTGPGRRGGRGRPLRLDDWELSAEVQAEVSRRWPLLTTETLGDLADLPEYRRQFLRLFGFGVDGVDYAQDVDPRVVPVKALSWFPVACYKYPAAISPARWNAGRAMQRAI